MLFGVPLRGIYATVADPAAYDALVNQFVQERKNAYNSVNALQQLPDSVKNRWQESFLIWRIWLT